MTQKLVLKRVTAAGTETVPEANGPLPSYWSGVIGVEGTPTGDGRMIERNALNWSLEDSLPLRYVKYDTGAHDGAIVVGHIRNIGRASNGDLTANGDFDLDSDDGREAARQVQAEVMNGVSMDIDSMSLELRVAAEVLEAITEDVDEGEEQPTDEDGRVTVAEFNADDELEVMTAGRIRAVTLVAIPAFSDAKIAPTDEEPVTASAAEEPYVMFPAFRPYTDEYTKTTDPSYVIASAIPNVPPREWFDNPELNEPTALVVMDDGKVYGHLAVWDTCHTGFSGECLQPPHSESDYGYFRTGSIVTSNGEVNVGHLTLDTRHAGKTLSAASAISHYEDTGATVADVAAGEDSFGIWVAGALRSRVSDEQVRSLRSAPLSGDWRRLGGALELVAALAVNVPGFPVPRPQGMAASGSQMTSLMASGMVPPKKVRANQLSEDDIHYLKRLAAQSKRDDQKTVVDEMAATLSKKKTRVIPVTRKGK